MLHTHLIRLLGASLLAAWATGMLGQPPAARAASLTVNSAADQVDTNPGDGVCTTVSGVCTLRAAVQESNVRPGPDTITLPAGRYILALRGDDNAAAAGDLDLAGDLSIVGAGVAVTFIDGGGEGATGIDRVLHVLSNATASITNLRVQYGSKSLGGGILNDGALTIDAAAVTSNVADVGGGIQNYGSLSIVNSDIAGNVAHIGGGGINNNERGSVRIRAGAIHDNLVDGNNLAFSSQGGGVSNDGVMSVDDTRIERNALRGDFSFGAGIDQTGGRLTIQNSRITLNASAAFGQAWGGGIANRGGELIVRASSIDGNSASDRRPNDPNPDGLGGGGGVYNTTTATLDVADSRISDNITTGEASTASGAGVLNNGGAATFARTAIVNNRSALDGGGALNLSGTLTMVNVTLSGNQTQRDGGGLVTRQPGATSLSNVSVAANTAGGAGDGIFNTGTTQLVNTLIANSGSKGNCRLIAPLTSRGNNLEHADTCGLRGPADRPGQNPSLGPLGDNGGPSPTHALAAGSPAIDSGNSDASVCPATDQRGAPRPAGRGCDIGAYEAGSNAPLAARDRRYVPLVQR